MSSPTTAKALRLAEGLDDIDERTRQVECLVLNLERRHDSLVNRWADTFGPLKTEESPEADEQSVQHNFVAVHGDGPIRELVHAFARSNPGVDFSVAQFLSVQRITQYKANAVRNACRDICEIDPRLRTLDYGLYEYDGDPGRVDVREFSRRSNIQTARAWFEEHPLVEVGVREIVTICGLDESDTRRAGRVLRYLCHHGSVDRVRRGRYRAKLTGGG